MSENQNLLKRSVNAAKWNYLGNFTKVLLQFLIGVWLARLLGPEAFGVVAIAWLMIGAGKLISDFGFSAALIQRPDLTDQDVGFVFTVQVLIGLGLSLLGYSFSGQIASFFNHPPAEPVISVMAWLFLIQAVGQTTTAALNRGLRFKFSQIASVATYIFGYVCVGLPMAYWGYGAWSLVAAQMLQAGTYTAVVLAKSGIVIRPASRPTKPGIFRFGGKVIGANILYYLNQNLDSFIVGRFFGASPLGVYNRAMTLLSTPASVVASGLNSILFAAASREKGNDDAVKRGFLAASEFVALVCFPIFITVAAAPKTVILGVYGDAWCDAISLATPLALAMAVYAVQTVNGPALMAVNKTEYEVAAQLMSLVINVPLLYFSGQSSLDHFVWAVFATYLVRWLSLAAASKAVLKVSLFDLIDVVRSGLIIAFPVASISMIVDRHLSMESYSLKLFAIILVAAFAYLLCLRAFGPTLAKGQFLKLLQEREALPQLVGQWLRVPQAPHPAN